MPTRLLGLWTSRLKVYGRGVEIADLGHGVQGYWADQEAFEGDNWV